MGVAVSAELSRFLVTEFDHPEPHIYKWTTLELKFINDRIRTAMAAERYATLDAVLRGLRSEDDSQQLRAIIASVDAMRSNEELCGARRASEPTPGSAAYHED